MEKTELRAQFFADSRADPYLHAVSHHVACAWADGYEQALRDHGLDKERLRESHSDRVARAVEWLTDSRRRAQVEALVAFAALGKLLPRPTL